MEGEEGTYLIDLMAAMQRERVPVEEVTVFVFPSVFGTYSYAIFQHYVCTTGEIVSIA